MTDKPYRKNVAVIVLNSKGEILCCERCDIPNAWQLPQGGIEKGESELEAMHRELMEEVGFNDVELVDQLPEKILYDWPLKIRKNKSDDYINSYRGQEQTFFLVRAKEEILKNFVFSPTEEFCNFRWVNREEFFNLIVGFKVEPYKKAIQLFEKRNERIFA